ncbi:hypothetical protein Tco_1562758 [Tanacetum coccineum]
MSSITAQQTKLDLELVPKENRFDIGKFNGRIPHGFSPREPTFPRHFKMPLKDLTSGSSKGTKSQPKSSRKSIQSEELVFEVADSDMPQDQEGNMGDNEDEPRKKTASRRDWFKKPTPPQEPTDPDWNIGKTTQEGPTQNLFDDSSSYHYSTDKLKRQRVPFKFFINNDLKYLQGGISTMTYTTSTTKTKAAKYDLPGIEDMVPNIWSHVKVAYDKYALWGISHWREQHNPLMSRLEGRHGYGYLEGFPKNVSPPEVPGLFRTIEDLQLGVESYQKKINVTKPNTTRPYLRKRHPYTPDKNPPRNSLMVDDHKRNRLMRSDELYKFSDGTLTRLLSSLEDITKNIDMKYLPKRRQSNLEKKRAHFMIKDINKLLKERRMMRSLEKFISGRLYGTDLGMLQRTI